jgi:RNA polymerase sigma-70 factor (sigma-E family)
MAAGLDRYRGWLSEHAVKEPARPQAIPVAVPAALRASLADAHASTLAAVIGEAVDAGETTRPGAGAGSGTPAAGVGWGAEQAAAALHGAHYRSLLGLAALLVRDVATAEEVVQDSFIALHAAWPRLRDNERALSYLRQCVVNRSRSVLRHRVIVDRIAPDLPAAEQDALTLLERSAVIAALWALPPRQREALVLRYYGDLSEAQIASAMGISRGTVKSHLARAIASLRDVLGIE